MGGQNVGYVRVSTTDQNTARQLDGVTLDRIFEEKASAKDVRRPVLQDCLSFLREGDCLHVHSIDRLARNLSDLEKLVGVLTKKGVVVRFHKEGLTFTGQDDPMQRLLFQLLGAVSEFERALIKERQREGIAAAKKAGKHLGRPSTLTPDQLATLMARVAAGEAKKALAGEFGISRATLYKVIG